MRSALIAIAALTLGCHHTPATQPPPRTSAPDAAASATSAPAAAAPTLPPEVVAQLAAYGPPHGQAIYVPAAGKDVEHWLAFVGGDAAMSAWLVTPSDPAHVLSQIAAWPTGLRVIAGWVEAGNHGLVGNADSSNAYLLVESLPGLGQPGGLHGLVRVDITAAQFVSSAVQDDGFVIPFAAPHATAAIRGELDALAADHDATLGLLSDELRPQLAARLGVATDLAALVPTAGVDVATTWQGTFAGPRAHVATVDALRAVIANRTWACDFLSCTADDETAVLGTEAGKLVIRAVLRAPEVAPPAAGARRVIAGGPGTPASADALRALGTRDAQIIAEAPAGAHGTVALAVGPNLSALIVRDGARVVQVPIEADDATPAANVRFLDVDGDGLTDVALVRADGRDTPAYTFTSQTGARDVGADIAAIGASSLDDAVARALALPDQPVAPAAACALLRTIKDARSLAKAGDGRAIVYAFTEPTQPEVAHTTLGKDAGRAIRDDLQGGCDLSCDPVRPVCTTNAEGPGIDYFLFTGTGAKLRLTVATVYRGS